MGKKAVLLSVLVVFVCLFAAVLNASADFKDDFSDTNYRSNGWYTYILLGNPNNNYLYPERRRVSFHMPNYDTAIYFINENTEAENSTVEATFENVFSSNAQYGVICRYHDYGWYELRIIVTGEYAGTYTVYKYDQYLKSQGKTPYVTLHPGMDRYYTYDIKLGINAKNTLKMICQDDEIRIFINNVEQFPLRNGTIHDSDFQDGENGVMIWTQVPGGEAQIDLTNFKATFESQN